MTLHELLQGNHPDLMATTADYLRIWHLTDNGVVLQKLLNNVRLYIVS